MNYPATSLRMHNKLNQENITIEEFKNKAKEKLSEIQIEEEKNKKIRAEHKRLEINRNMIYEMLRSQNFYQQKVTEILNNTKIYVYALKQINTKYGLNYIMIASLTDN